MSQTVGGTAPTDSLASATENCASRVAPRDVPSSKPVAAPKLRSCVVCRARKVRCDKQSPCSNCRRANTACLYPKTNRPPRWARRFEHHASNAAALDALQDADPDINQVLNRLHNLEDLV